MSGHPPTEEGSQGEKKKKIRPENENKEELDMPAAVLKEKSRVESPPESPDKEEMVPDWMRDLMRSLRFEEEKKRGRPE